MDLTSHYLGLTLKGPLVPSASPLSRSLDAARALEDAGAGAIVMHSLFEEAINEESESMVRFLHHQEIGSAEAASFLPDQDDFPSSLDLYLEQLRSLKEALDIPVIASLNGITPGGWVEYARELEAAGADGIELNVYYVAADPHQSGARVEARYLDLLRCMRRRIQLPINLKLSPHFSSLGHMAHQFEAAGANGLALFNRFYQPDINIDSLRLQASLHPSTSAEVLLPMRWIAILYGRTQMSLGATSGVHTPADAIKLLLAGADVVHLCSVLLEKGPAYLAEIQRGIEQWMEEQGFDNLVDVRGRLSALSVPNPAELERANYLQILSRYRPAPGVRV